MDYIVFSVLSPVAVLIFLISIKISFPYRNTRDGKALLFYMFTALGFLLANIAELHSVSEDYTLLWAKIQHLFLSCIPIGWLNFALHYGGYSKIADSIPLKIVLFIIPVLTAVFALSYPFLDLFYVDIGFLRYGGFVTLRPQYGVFFWVYGFYFYMVLVSGIIVVSSTSIRSRGFLRHQWQVIFFGFLVTPIFNLIYVFRIFPGLRKDYTPISFAVSALFFTLGIVWYRLLKLTPIARSVIENEVEDALVVFSWQERLVDFNDPARKLFRLNDNMIGKDAQTIPDMPVLEDSTGKMQEIRKIGKFHYEYRVRNIAGPKGDIMGTLVLVRNVTETALLLDEKIRYARELEKAHEQLQQTQTRYVQQERLAAIGELAAGVAHEINNPLGFLKSNLYSLNHFFNVMSSSPAGEPRRKEAEKQIFDIIGDIGDGLDVIVRVTKSMLRFARQSPDVIAESYDLNEGIEDTLNILRHEYKYFTEIEKDFEPLPSLICIGNEVNQVLLNILTNAIYAVKQKYAPHQERGLIRINTYYRAGTIYCSIANNGDPIPADMLPKIFDPFFTSKPTRIGTGLGLSIVKDIIEQRMGGKISVETGVETVFLLEFPVGNIETDSVEE